MPLRSAGISGVGVATAAAGALLMYAGIRDVPLLTALRDVTGGRLPKGNAAKDHTGTSAAATAAFAALHDESVGAGSSSAVQVSVSGGALPQLASAALAYRGVPYVLGGNTRAGMDCSGLVFRSFADIGITAPRTTYTQQPWRSLHTIDAAAAGAGDLVFWPGHVAIVVAGGTVIHSPRPGRTVEIVPIAQAMPKGSPKPVYKRYGAAAPPKSAQV